MKEKGMLVILLRSLFQTFFSHFGSFGCLVKHQSEGGGGGILKNFLYGGPPGALPLCLNLTLSKKKKLTEKVPLPYTGYLRQKMVQSKFP